MYKALIQIKETFEAHDLRFQAGENSNQRQFIALNIRGDSSSYGFHLISNDDNFNDVGVRVFDLITVPEHKRSEVLRRINRLNSMNGMVIKFILEDDNTVEARYDFAPSFEPIGEGAVEILYGMTKILDAVYPELEQAVTDL